MDFNMEKCLFYPSVSSIAKNRLSAMEHIEVLLALEYPYFLISAYDFANFTPAEKTRINQKVEENNIDLLLDSGMYEKAWSGNTQWDIDKYLATIKEVAYRHVFNFDGYINPQDIPLDKIKASISDSDIQNLVPIIHTSNIEDLPILCREVASLDKVEMIAIPERELGNGILEGMHTIIRIREELAQLDKDTKIHLLGTGNPLALLIYSAFGVDSFDGLDWCQTVADFDTATLHHSLQLDFFAHQSSYGSNKSMSYMVRLFAHNLEFYTQWMNEINSELEKGSIDEMMRYYLPTVISGKVLEAYCEKSY
jgi:hypothetical protein